MERLSNFPFFLILMGMAAAAMLPPIAVAVQASEWGTARAFFYSAGLLGTLVGMLAIALNGYRPENISRTHLITLIGAYLGLPLLFAFPFIQSVPNTSLLNAYFEMSSAFTTTGATTYDPARLSGALHLWRAEVGWLGGLFLWVTAAAILAPQNLGGYEISATTEPGRGFGGSGMRLPGMETPARLARVFAALFPIYAGLTVVLWICLIIADTEPLTGLIYAMSTMSTSGITMAASGAPVVGDYTVEFLILLFLLFALSRRTFSTEGALKTSARLVDDPEIRVAGFLILLTTATLFLRHFIGAVEVGTEVETVAGVSALWGGLFTVVSFLTTTGFVSEHWADAQNWSGLATPGFVLLGLAVVGGGVATTAGGVKLLRVFALYVHGQRELQRLLHPSVVSGMGREGRRVSSRGVYIAWLFFMLFALSIAAVWVGLASYGVAFEDAMLLTISALSTTGSLAAVVSDGAVQYADLANPVKMILLGAMVLGRLETLVLIALLNVDFWRS